MNSETKLSVYKELIRCCHNLYFWEYDRELNPLSSNCPDERVVGNLFAIGSNQEMLLSYAKKHRKPIILTSEMDFMWVAVPEHEEGELAKIYAIGPFFIDSVSTATIEANLGRLSLTPALRQEVVGFLRELPVISLSRVFEYSVMLHYCISGERICASDLHYQESEKTISKAGAAPTSGEVHGTYEAEQEMVRMVREGNLNYRKHMDKMAITGSLGKLSNSDTLRQMKNAVFVCITLFSRAAIEGGLAPEISMTLTDHYFQSADACTNIPELKEINYTMQEDFIQRVHRCRARKFSKPVMDCCDYIGMHLENELTLCGLAKWLNYSEYYLSRKFKQDTGITVNEYIRRQRLERAKELLDTTHMSVQDISEKLQFCSQSYFAEAFRKNSGVSPTVWRETLR